MRRQALYQPKLRCQGWWGAIAGGLLLSAIAAPGYAQESFGVNGVQFDVDTVVEFEFIESNGAYQSTMGVVNLETGEKTPLFQEVKPSDNPQPLTRPSSFTRNIGLDNSRDFLGTPGNTVPEALAEFTFRANTRYAFYLESFLNGRQVGILYSTEFQGGDDSQQIRFEGGVGNLGNQGVTIFWDDTGSALVKPNAQDRDFDDFLVRAGGHLACPYNVPTAQQPSSQSLSASGGEMLISQAICR